MFLSEYTLRWRQEEEARIERLWKDEKNFERRVRRKWLYDNDPIWRLTKNKDNRERRLRAKRKLEG